MTAAQRLIVALDTPHDIQNPDRPIEVKDALKVVETLEGVVSFFKVGWPLYLAKDGERVVSTLVNMGKRVFLDLKYGDIPETVKKLVGTMSSSGAELITITGGTKTAEAAVEARNAKETPLRILLVTLLTSMDESDLRNIGVTLSASEYALRVARLARKSGCDGIVCSGREAAAIRQESGKEFLIVTPGIRPSGHSVHDHKRPVTPTDSILAGADYLVVGRPIVKADDPRGAALSILAEMDHALELKRLQAS